jgi:hypothetical protein
MGSSLLAQTTGSVNPNAAPVEPSVKQDDLPPGGCLPNWVGRGRRWTQAATPDRAGTHGNRSILHDFEDDRISRHVGNETRLLSFMSALRVNAGTAKQKDRPKGGRHVMVL